MLLEEANAVSLDTKPSRSLASLMRNPALMLKEQNYRFSTRVPKIVCLFVCFPSLRESALACLFGLHTVLNQNQTEGTASISQAEVSPRQQPSWLHM